MSPSLYVRLGYKMDRCLWGTPKGWNNALEKNGAKGSRFRWGERQGDGNEKGGLSAESAASELFVDVGRGASWACPEIWRGKVYPRPCPGK